MTEDPRPAHRADRLRRAWALVKAGKVERIAGSTTQFRIAGNQQEFYFVDLDGDPPCYCADMDYRGREIKQMCKHVGAARLASLDAALLGVVADWLEIEQAQADAVSRAPKQRAGAAATRRTG